MRQSFTARRNPAQRGPQNSSSAVSAKRRSSGVLFATTALTLGADLTSIDVRLYEPTDVKAV